MAVKLGELYMELGIEDVTEQAYKRAQQKATEFEQKAKVEVPVTADDSALAKNLDAAKKKFDALAKKVAEPMEVDADADKLLKEFEAAQREVQKLERLTKSLAPAKVKVEVDTKEVRPKLAAVNAEFDDARRHGADPIRPGVDLSELEGGGGRVTDIVSGWITAAAAGGLLLGGAIAAKVWEGFEGYMARDAAGDVLAAQLGLNDWEAAYYGRHAAEIYKQNWGESIGAVNEAIRAAKLNGLIDPQDTSGDELDSITEKLLTLQDAFGQDLGMSAQAAGQLVATGLVKDPMAALDLLTRGLQITAGKSDDLMETWQEYSTLFRALGLDGPVALGLIQQGLVGGARDADTVADALKEAQIRMTDGSDASREAYKLLGLDADKYTKMAAEGGDGAATALDDILDALRKTDDPVKRNAAAVGLFGTKAEDLGAALFALDPETAAAGLGKIAGAADEAGTVLGDNLAGKWETWKRTAEIGLQDYLGGLVAAYDEGGLDGLTERVGEDLSKLGDWWNENGEEITDAASAWWEETGSPLLAAAVEEAMGVALDAAWGYLNDKITDPNWWLTALAGAGNPIRDWMNPERAAEWAAHLAAFLDEVPDALGATIGTLWDPLTESFRTAINQIIEWWNGLDFTINTPVGSKTIGTPDIDPVGDSGSTGPWVGQAVNGSTAFGGLGLLAGMANIQLPKFHGGGWVPGPAGQEIVAKVQGGERVRTQEQERELMSTLGKLAGAAAGGGTRSRGRQHAGHTFVGLTPNALDRQMRKAVR